MYYRLVLVSSSRGSESQSWNLTLPSVVGRGSEANVCVDDESISRSHCKIYLGPDEALLVRDQGSTNGTYINGQRVAQPHSLAPEDVLQIGSVSLRIEYASDTDPGPNGPKQAKSPTASTQRMQTLPSQKFTMHESEPTVKRWWEFWKP